jgi:polyhydroxyalkanoate synthase subunit PhaC
VPPAPSALLDRIGRDVDRAVRRGRNGLRYAAGTSRPKVGQTPKDVVWRRDKAELWRYRSDDVAYRPPVLVVHSLVSRSYVLDLYPGNSAVQHLLKSGLDMMLLDWGAADEVEAQNTLETYVDDYIPEAIGAACEVAGTEDVTLLGYCFGGVLSLLAAARHTELPIRNLVLMATPVDFSEMQGITSLVQSGRLDADDLIDETGNVPPEAVESAFRLLKPTAEVSQYATLWEHLWNDEYMEGYQAMGQWVHDHVPFPGATARQTICDLVRDNGLMQGTLELGGERVDLHEIRMPVLNVVAERDHIVPIRAAEPVPELVGTPDAEELRLHAGHVGLVAGRSAAKVTLPGIADWIEAHSERVGGEG